jgi:putative transposase
MGVRSTNNRTQSGSERERRKWMSCRQVRMPSLHANERWSLDVVVASFHSQRFRILAVADDFTRECLGLVVDTSFTALRVAGELKHIIEIRGLPRMIVRDCASEFTSFEMSTLCVEFGIFWCDIFPGYPTQRVCAESLNRRVCNECIKEKLFANLNEARQIIEEWRVEYNKTRTLA